MLMIVSTYLSGLGRSKREEGSIQRVRREIEGGFFENQKDADCELFASMLTYAS